MQDAENERKEGSRPFQRANPAWVPQWIPSGLRPWIPKWILPSLGSPRAPHTCVLAYTTFVACRDFSALPSLLEVLTPPGEARPRDLSSSRGPGVSFFRPLRIDI